jgi:multidrug efflux pump subunit AcrB/outer membrane protein TolC
VTSIIRASLRYPIVTLIVTVLIVATGIHAFLTMPRTEDPSITIRTGLVIAEYPGATSAQVEQQVTHAIEDRLFTFPEVRKEKTYSTSRPGLSFINVELQDSVTNADVFWSKLREAMLVLSQTTLPSGVRGPIVNSDFGDTVALLIAVHGKPYDYRSLRDYVDRIQDELRTIGDVGRLLTYGEQNEQIRITSSLERLSQYLTDPTRIAQALQQRNIILPSGKLDTKSAAIPFRTTGLFTTEEEVRNVLVDISSTGQPIYIRDFGSVERRYEDPTFVVRYDGDLAVLLSVEMQKGRNIVQMGEQVDAGMQRLRSGLPPDLRLDFIANQSAVVKERISGLSREFLLAIGSVILVTVVLLPIRVAAIAALAIPVTICATLALMNAIGVALHQVSIAALIVVLGIVVDDAIVIADNYLELLDHGVPREEAAWRSAAEVVVPVLTATMTIIASFLPLLILSGSTGEFIWALPITVASALSVSFIVAILLTPILCRFFIRKGLHDAQVEPAKKKRDFLDVLQAVYNRSILVLMKRRALALVFGAGAVVAGVLLGRFIPQQFFPSAERNQFVVDVWMPEGTRIEATDAVMRRIEDALRQRREVVHFATFVGQSAPRFYYNVNPQQPDLAYGQFIVNTTDEKETPGLVADFRDSLARVAPEALVVVKELQQGAQVEAPVEIRISGTDLGTLKQLGNQVESLVSSIDVAQLVHNDYFNDSLIVNVNVNDELANRLGLSNANVSKVLEGGLSGAPVSTYWEGNRAITLLLRLDADRRTSFEDVRGAYVNSPMTHASVPLRSISTLEPTWQTSRIVRRNGVRTLTVRSFVKHGAYASKLLDRVNAKLKELKVPDGYRIAFGGEISNQDETFPQLLMALSISLVAIFLVLLIQFRTGSDPPTIMCSIPLALFGAVLGLLITRNPFGFTAFIGLISLAGIVVRNAIILIEYVHERMKAGVSLVDAATEAGERRLRPIFLTTMAAAVGVTPMILSRSTLWSPLASVLAFGLLFSMFFTLLIIPVLFVVVQSRFKKPPVPVSAMLLCLIGTGCLHGQPVKLTLEEAVNLALEQNSSLKIAHAKVRESVNKQVSARADYLPQLSNSSYFFGYIKQQQITIPAGALGVIPTIGLLPAETVILPQGSNMLEFVNVILSQPLTELLKIREGNRIAASDRRISESDLRKAEQDVAYMVRQLYFGLLAMTSQKEMALADVATREELLRESENDVRSGTSLDVVAVSNRAALLLSRQTAHVADYQIADLTDEFLNVLGLAPGTQIELADVSDPNTELLPVADYLSRGLANSEEVKSATEAVSKAQTAVRAARDEYIPNLDAVAAYTYQNGVPFLPHNNGNFGVQMTWNVFDWGKRKGVVGQREAQVAQAEANLRKIRDQLTVDIQKAYRKLERSRELVIAATAALAAQKENERIVGNQVLAGFASQARSASAFAATRKSEYDVMQARLSLRLADAEMQRITAAPVRP